MSFLSANWLWILLIGFMVWMHLGHHRGHHAGHGSHHDDTGSPAEHGGHAEEHRHGC